MAGHLKAGVREIAWEDTVILRQPGSRSLTVHIPDEAHGPDIHFDFKTPAEAAAGCLYLVSRKEQDLDAATSELAGVIGHEVLAEAA